MSKYKWYKSIRARMLISYFAVVLMILVVGIGGIYHIKRVYRNGNRIYDTNLKSVDYLKTLNINVRQIDQRVLSMLQGLGNMTVAEYRAEIEKLQESNDLIMEEYEKLKFSDLEKRRYKQCRLSMLTLDKNIESLMDMVEEGNVDGAKSLYDQELMPVEACTFELLDAVAELATKNAEESNADNYGIYQRIMIAIIITIILAVLLAVVISLRVSGTIAEKLGIIQRWAKRISEYNVSEDIKELGEDEFGVTSKALNDAQFMIRDLVEKIMEESTLISDTGKEISGSIRKSKQRIEEMNLKMLESDKGTMELVNQIKDIMLVNSLPPELIEKMKALNELTNNNSVSLDLFQEELNSMATYMEQIAITSDHQNKMAEEHKEQVRKFKVKKDPV